MLSRRGFLKAAAGGAAALAALGRQAEAQNAQEKYTLAFSKAVAEGPSLEVRTAYTDGTGVKTVYSYRVEVFNARDHMFWLPDGRIMMKFSSRSVPPVPEGYYVIGGGGARRIEMFEASDVRDTTPLKDGRFVVKNFAGMQRGEKRYTGPDLYAADLRKADAVEGATNITNDGGLRNEGIYAVMPGTNQVAYTVESGKTSPVQAGPLTHTLFIADADTGRTALTMDVSPLFRNISNPGIAASRDGRFVAVGQGVVDVNKRAAAVEIGYKEALPPFRAMRFSPEGSLLGYASGGDVAVLDLGLKRERRLGETRGFRAQFIDWLPDGSEILFFRYDAGPRRAGSFKGLFATDVRTGTTRQVLSPDVISDHFPPCLS